MLDKRFHTTQLKVRIMRHFLDLKEHKQVRDVFLRFQENIGSALAKARDYYFDTDTVHLARAAHIIRKNMFKPCQLFDGTFTDKFQEESVPELLLTFVSMVLEGACIKNQACQSSSSASLMIAQLLKYNAVKHDPKSQIYTTTLSDLGISITSDL